MFTDFLGAALNLTQLAGSESVYRLEFVDDSEEALDLSGATFSGTVTACSDGAVFPLGVAASAAETNVIGLSFPELELGNYTFELMATDDSGASLRLVYGQILVLTTSLDLGMEDGQTIKRLQVREPGAEARSLQLKWLSSSIAQLSAEEAETFAKRAEAAAEGVEETIKIAEEAAIGNIDQAAEAAAESLAEAVNTAEASINATATEAVRTLNEAEASGLANFADAQKEIDESVARAENAAESAEANATETDSIMKEATDFMADFNDKVQKAISIRGNIWYIGDISTGVQAAGDPGMPATLSATNNWLVYDNELQTYTDTGVCAEGKDGAAGIDGDTVRRIKVESYEAIPKSGETCSGGYYYYVWIEEVAAIAATGFLDYSTGLTNELGLEVNGVSIPDDSSGLTGDELLTYWINAICTANCGVTATASSSENRIVLTAAFPGDEGNAITLALTNTETTVALSGDTLTGGADAIPAHYDVFAWLEEDGAGAWHKIGERNDIATAKVYGLVKLSTDTAQSDGGLIGVNSAGQMLVRPASYGIYGAVKPSTNAVPTTHCIGVNNDGTLSVQWAQLDYAGVVRLGSQFEMRNEMPYLMGVGSTEDHKISNNLLWEGALQYRMNSDWLTKTDQMPWLAEAAAEHPDHYTDKYGLAVLTTPQFTQSEDDGLQLLPATTTLLAGVYLATGLDDARANAVLTAAQSKSVKEELDQNLADTKTELNQTIADTKSELVAKYDAEVERLDASIASTKSELVAKYDAEVERLDEADAALKDTFASYYTQKQVDTLLANQYEQIVADLKAWVTAQAYDTIASVDSKLKGYVKTTESVTEIQALTTEEFNNLDERNDTTLYLN